MQIVLVQRERKCIMSRSQIVKATSLATCFSVASILFSSHAGGGFASGNQANNFYINSGWPAVFSAVLAMALLTFGITQALKMYMTRGLNGYAELFKELWAPYSWVEIFVEIFYYVMFIVGISTSIAGAASAFDQFFGVPYIIGALIISIVVLAIVIFGATVLRIAASAMTIIILVTALTIYIFGIMKGQYSAADFMSASMAADGFSKVPHAIIQSFAYAGFQMFAVPALIGVSGALTDGKAASRSMIISFVMNAVALSLSCIMLMMWQPYYTSVEKGTTLPVLTSLQSMNVPILTVLYTICLILCMISTASTGVFGLTNKFIEKKPFVNMKSERTRRVILAVIAIVLGFALSLVGLTNLVAYGYRYCGYLSAIVIVIPLCIIGPIKNRKYIAEHGDANQNCEEITQE